MGRSPRGGFCKWLFLFCFCAFSLCADISALYLTWYDDPTTTMTIQWHTPDTEPGDVIYFQTEEPAAKVAFPVKTDDFGVGSTAAADNILKESRGGSGDRTDAKRAVLTGEWTCATGSEAKEWRPVDGSHQEVAHLLVHAVSLQNLTPDTDYSFRIGKESAVYKFRTAPATLDHPIRFVIGGDAFQTNRRFQRMNQTVAQLDPLFCVIGGDIAYAINVNPFRLKSTTLHRWTAFLSQWKEQMVAPDGRLIPFVLVAGNHDIAKNHDELFFSLFAFPQRQLYRALDFGTYLSLILLDTGHFQPIEGEQTAWLDATLKDRSDAYCFAVYHIAAYPSFYPYDGTIPQKIRTHWCPLFDKYQLPVAFENHNHTFKKTYPMNGGKIDPEGVLYLGDGCWGVVPRKTHKMWYLEEQASKNHIYCIDLSAVSAKVQAIDLFGVPFSTTILRR